MARRAMTAAASASGRRPGSAARSNAPAIAAVDGVRQVALLFAAECVVLQRLVDRVAAPAGRPFASGAVFVVDADGENLRQLSPGTVNVRDPDWSPDGSQIVFYGRPRSGGTESSSVHSNVYVVRPDGTDLRQLTSDNVSLAPTWTDDGRILFVRISIVTGVQAEDFWLMDADGQNQLALGLTGLAGQCCSQRVAWQPVP